MIIRTRFIDETLERAIAAGATQVLIRDEPRLSGIPLDEEKSFPADLGLDLREMLTIGGEYLTRTDGTVVGDAALTRVNAG
jgi:hypothetical protein